MKQPDIIDTLCAWIKDFILESSPGSKLADQVDLKAPRQREFGDLTCHIAFRLAKEVRKNPRDIATALAAYLEGKIKASAMKGLIERVEPHSQGFINFLFTNAYFSKGLTQIIDERDVFGKHDVGKGKPVLIEFVSANPTGPLSIAHARQAAVGDSLARILSFLGYKAQKEYYLNDEGHQIEVLGVSTQLRLKELQGEKVEFPEDGYQGEYIYDIARKIIDQKIDVSKWTREDFSAFAVKDILADIEKDLLDFDVTFDSWTSQKGIRESGKITKALDLLREKGYVFEEEGATWFKSTAFTDDKDRVVIKSDGSYTYLAPDIAYHQEKFRRGFEWLINLWGPDHHGYINRLKASVSAFGKDAGSLSVIIVQLATIYKEGKPVVMSTRRGQLITLREVLDDVGKDAARFFFLMRRTNSHLDFDLTLAKQQTPQNPVFYIQYAYARINSIIEKAREELSLKGDLEKCLSGVDFSVLQESEELNLLRTMLQLPFVLKACEESLDPQPLTAYLQDLAADFHKFYDLHRVLGQEEAVIFARLGLCWGVKTVLTNGLTLLGVSRPQKM